MQNRKSVVAGMSGGVDSAVAALLLKRQGYDLTGVFMKNWEETDSEGECMAAADAEDAAEVCRRIGIPFYTVNFVKEYQERVFSYFLAEYERGRTPNPDVLCNCEIKFKAFLDFAIKTGAEALATGHYARVEHINGKAVLKKALDKNKDQTYFLSMLNQAQLSRAIFPLGELQKSEVRRIAREAGLPVSEKKDSTGICFIGERKFKEFLSNFLPAKPGDMVSADGEKVGTHDGLMYYTLGQRRGLGIGGRGTGERWFVVEKDLKGNRLIVAQGSDHEKLYSKACKAGGLSFIAGEPPAGEFDCKAKFRYRQPDQDVHVKLDGGAAHIEFAQRQRAVTPGQYAVFYDGGVCLGGGVVDEVYP